MKSDYFKNEYPLEELIPDLKEHECYDLIHEFENGLDTGLTIQELMQELIIIGHRAARDEVKRKLKAIKIVSIEYETQNL